MAARHCLAALWLGWAGVGPLLLAQAAQAELPPWVYADQQQRAPLVLELNVIGVRRWPALQPREWLVQTRVLAVQRQSPLPGRPPIRSGTDLSLRYALPPQRPSGWVGPSPLRPLQAGEQVMAWLAPDSAHPGWWVPAAGGHSFGPPVVP